MARKVTQGRGVKAALAGWAVKTAIDFVNNPDNMKLLVGFVRDRSHVVATPLVGKASLTLPKGKWGRLEQALGAADAAIADAREQHVEPSVTEGWARSLASLRAALPLARAAQGRERRRKLTDLQQRTNTLLNEIYAAMVASAEDPQG